MRTIISQSVILPVPQPTWRLWARDAAIEKKNVLKARGYAWSPGEFGRPRCWYRDVADADKAAEVSWLRQNVMGVDQAVWALRITAKDRYSDRCWAWGECLNIELDWPADRSGGRWSGKPTTDASGRGMPILFCSGSAALLSKTRPIEPKGGRLAFPTIFTSRSVQVRLIDRVALPAEPF